MGTGGGKVATEEMLAESFEDSRSLKSSFSCSKHDQLIDLIFLSTYTIILNIMTTMKQQKGAEEQTQRQK